MKEDHMKEDPMQNPQPQPQTFVIRADQIQAIGDFIGGLNLPWKQTNAYMQILIGLQPIQMQPAARPALRAVGDADETADQGAAQ